MPDLSGPNWVSRFPTSVVTSDLTASFSASVDRFIAALRAGGATVSISATFRPPERAFLMHYAWRIARENFAPESVPTMPGVDIDWVHRNSQGVADLSVSRVAARQMVAGYAIVHKPSLTSRHTEGRAIDMTITNYTHKTYANAAGQNSVVTTAAGLNTLGASYGVHKLVSDPPHWSDDGH